MADESGTRLLWHPLPLKWLLIHSFVPAGSAPGNIGCFICLNSTSSDGTINCLVRRALLKVRSRPCNLMRTLFVIQHHDGDEHMPDGLSTWDNFTISFLRTVDLMLNMWFRPTQRERERESPNKVFFSVSASDVIHGFIHFSATLKTVSRRDIFPSSLWWKVRAFSIGEFLTYFVIGSPQMSKNTSKVVKSTTSWIFWPFRKRILSYLYFTAGIGPRWGESMHKKEDGSRLFLRHSASTRSE